MIGQETLMNYVGGHWEEAAGAQTIPVRNPATGEVDRRRAAVVGNRRRQGGEGRVGRAAGVAADAGRRSHPAAVPAQGAARRALQRDRQAHHAGVRQDARRVGRRAQARHRERRGRDRHPVADDGQQPRGHRLGDRRADDSSAGRGRRRHHAVQLSRHDSALVPAVRRRLRQHGRPQAVGEDAAHDGARAPADRAGRIPVRRGQPRARRQGCGGRAPRSPRGPGDLVRRLDARRALHLQPRGGQRQARAVPGRREEPDRRAARRRHGHDDAGSSPTRRSAAPASAVSRLPWSSPWRRHRSRSRSRSAMRPHRARSATASTRARRWARSSRQRAARASRG